MSNKFRDLGLTEEVTRAISDMGWFEPTPIQEATIPYGLSGRDLFGQAQTGTGKTGAYGGIILGRMEAGQKVPRSIILVPTRELANQVAGEMVKLSKYTGHKTVAVYGGAAIEGQVKKLEQGSDVIAGTPGRILDLADRGVLNLSEIQCLVLDEADRMLDMGFLDDMTKIISLMPEEKQTLLFSATMPESVKALAFDSMHDPKEIVVSEDELIIDTIKQYYISVGRRNKIWALSRILSIDKPKAIIFCQTKKMVDILEERLKELEYKVEAIHGDMAQGRRERVIKDIKDDKIDFLIATDVAARGLDIDDISFVINYDMPEEVDTYIHRIGRTGRAGKEGTAVSFVSSTEEHLVKEFELRTGIEIEKREVPEDENFKDIVKKVVDYDQISDVYGMAKFEINLGKNDGYGRVSLADFIIRNARVNDTSIGKIQMGEESSIVEVHRDFGNRMTMDLTKCKHKGKHITVKVIQ